MRENIQQSFYMRNKRVMQIWRAVAVITAGVSALVALSAVPAYADSCATNPDQQTCSNNYGVSESFFGTGGVDTCPTQGGNAYCAKQSAGELTVGNVKGTAYQAQAGFNTDRTEWISASIVGSPNVDLGVLDTGATKTGTAQFKVSAYLASGYAVQLYGAAPTYNGHALTSMNGAAASPGTEQFGVNLVANSVASATPNAFGADPVQDPDYPAQPFGFGAAATGYDTTNVFKFASGDVIAESDQSSGFTVYTLSYIANISSVTPAGEYNTAQTVVATATY